MANNVVPAPAPHEINGLAAFKVANPFSFWGRDFQKLIIFRWFSPQAQGPYCIGQVAGGEMGITPHHSVFLNPILKAPAPLPISKRLNCLSPEKSCQGSIILL